MLDHMILTVSDIKRSLAFYEAALKPLQIRFLMPYKGDIHWGFVAENNKKVDEFYEAAMSAGARDNISPRARLEYYPGYYAADVFDPDGYSFEVVHKS
jgi:catechol 2,3-dioxygenase-like lactoylglutathione lyase family enzyme